MSSSIQVWSLRSLSLFCALFLATLQSRTVLCHVSFDTAFEDLIKARQHSESTARISTSQRLGLGQPSFPGNQGPECLPVFSDKGPKTVCEFTFLGPVYDVSINVSEVVPGAMGTFNATAGLRGTALFDVTEDLLNLSFAYSGEISGDIKCPGGCNMPDELSGVVQVPAFHKLLTTPNGKVRTPENRGIRIFTDVEIPWRARLHAFANFSTSFRQKFGINFSAPGEPLVSDVPNTEAMINVHPSSFERPFAFGEFHASPVFRILYSHTSFVIRSLVSADTGLQLSVQSRRLRRFRRMNSTCQMARSSLRPVFRNGRIFLGSTQNLGWMDRNITEENLPHGRPFRKREVICAVQ